MPFILINECNTFLSMSVKDEGASCRYAKNPEDVKYEIKDYLKKGGQIEVMAQRDFDQIVNTGTYFIAMHLWEV